MSYDNDSRVRAARRGGRRDSFYSIVGTGGNAAVLHVKADGQEAWAYRQYDEGAEEGSVPPLPDEFALRAGEWEVCGMCRGNGKVVDPAIDGHGLSREDFDEDPGFKEDYFGGVYDIACPQCGGLRVTRDYEPCGKNRELAARFIALIDGLLSDLEDFDNDCAAERRMGA